MNALLIRLSCSLLDASAAGVQLFRVCGNGRMFINTGGYQVNGNSLINGGLQVWDFVFGACIESTR